MDNADVIPLWSILNQQIYVSMKEYNDKSEEIVCQSFTYFIMYQKTRLLSGCYNIPISIIKTNAL